MITRFTTIHSVPDGRVTDMAYEMQRFIQAEIAGVLKPLYDDLLAGNESRRRWDANHLSEFLGCQGGGTLFKVQFCIVWGYTDPAVSEAKQALFWTDEKVLNHAIAEPFDQLIIPFVVPDKKPTGIVGYYRPKSMGDAPIQPYQQVRTATPYGTV